MDTLSSRLADFLVGTRYDDLSAAVIQQAKKVLLDLTGVSLAGYHLMPFPKMVVDYVCELAGKPEATLIQQKRKVPAIHAALANASCAHALDMDDGHRFSASHPGTVIIPPAIAAAELTGADTKQILTGIVLGYEIMIRVGRAINPSSLARGFHITGITGTFGAAAAIAKIMDLSHEQTVAALGIAGLQSAGLIQLNHEVEGSMVKPINPARAAESGLLACLLAQKGAQGPLQIFEGEDGYLKAYSDEMKKDILTQDLGSDYEISKVYFKLYAACRHAHAAIDAASLALAKSGLSIDAIDSIVVETYPNAVRLSGIPQATSPSGGRFSIAFSVALVLIKQSGGADQYSEENVQDQNIQSLANKVQLRATERWERVYPQKRGATVTVYDHKGASWSAEVGLAKGEPENPARWEEINTKFVNNARLVHVPHDVEKMGEIIGEFENRELDDLTGLM